MAMLNDVKTVLGIEDDSLDAKLNLFINGASKKLISYLPANVTEVPGELDYIVQELVVIRFNRVGNEGMSSYSQEGESMSYNSDDMAPYLSDIEAYREKQEKNTKGVVRFL